MKEKRDREQVHIHNCLFCPSDKIKPAKLKPYLHTWGKESSLEKYEGKVTLGGSAAVAPLCVSVRRPGQLPYFFSYPHSDPSLLCL